MSSQSLLLSGRILAKIMKGKLNKIMAESTNYIDIDFEVMLDVTDGFCVELATPADRSDFWSLEFQRVADKLILHTRIQIHNL